MSMGFCDEPESGKLEASMRYLHWSYITTAVLDVFFSNQHQEKTSDIKASADVWAWFSERRREVYRRSRARWCELTGLDESWFPYSKDGLSRLYFRMRKRNQMDLQAFYAESRAAIPNKRKTT